MHDAASILLYGHDFGLLRSRAMILEQCNDTVSFTANEVLAIEILESCEIELRILCETLSEPEIDKFVTQGEWAWPYTKLLVMGRHDHRPKKILLTTQSESEVWTEFLDTVDRALGQTIH